MDTSKLKFDVSIIYDCNDGEGCNATLNGGTYEQVKSLIQSLKDRSTTAGYFHHMWIKLFEVHGENGEQLDLNKILDSEYGWIDDGYNAYDENEATATPCCLLDFLDCLKQGDEEHKDREIGVVKDRIKTLEKELNDAKEELAEFEEKK